MSFSILEELIHLRKAGAQDVVANGKVGMQRSSESNFCPVHWSTLSQVFVATTPTVSPSLGAQGQSQDLQGQHGEKPARGPAGFSPTLPHSNPLSGAKCVEGRYRFKDQSVPRALQRQAVLLHRRPHHFRVRAQRRGVLQRPAGASEDAPR